jgi:hypothetical protein
VLPKSSAMIHETVYHHSRCHAHCNAISASDMLDT